jgi:hypothetical protein
VLWRFTDGRRMETPPRIADREIAEVAAAARVHGPTRIDVARHNGLVRVRVRVSCGEPRLDELAAQAVTREILSDPSLSPAGGGAPPGVPGLIPIETGRQSLDIEWRFCPGVVTVPPPSRTRTASDREPEP